MNVETEYESPHLVLQRLVQQITDMEDSHKTEIDAMLAELNQKDELITQLEAQIE